MKKNCMNSKSMGEKGVFFLNVSCPETGGCGLKSV